MCNEFNEILYKGLELAGVQKLSKSNNLKKSKNSKKSWFNSNCAIARKNLRQMASKISKHPFARDLRQSYYKQRKGYKKLLKSTHNRFKGALK